MTPRQKDVYDYVSRHIVEAGYSPTYREIAHAVWLKSTGEVCAYIDQLCSLGHLRRRKRGKKGLELVSRMEFYLVGPYHYTGLECPDWPPMIPESEWDVLRRWGILEGRDVF